MPDLCIISRSSSPKAGVSFLFSSSRDSCRVMRVVSGIRLLMLIHTSVVVEWEANSSLPSRHQPLCRLHLPSALAILCDSTKGGWDFWNPGGHIQCAAAVAPGPLVVVMPAHGEHVLLARPVFQVPAAHEAHCSDTGVWPDTHSHCTMLVALAMSGTREFAGHAVHAFVGRSRYSPSGHDSHFIIISLQLDAPCSSWYMPSSHWTHGPFPAASLYVPG